MQGWRLEMEDAHVSVDLPSALDHLFLAVFDGHAGGGAAKYAASNIVRVLENNSDFKKYVATGCEDIKLLGDAMTRVFVDLDEEIKDHQMKSADDSSGCTAVTAIVTPKFIMCINAGDSRCVLGTNGTFKELSFDHKPYNEKERTRITDAGGFVQWNRVDGDLAVSRALGDFTYKNFNGPPEKQKVLIY